LIDLPQAHAVKREQFYGPLRDKFWPELYDMEYALFDLYLISQEEIAEIRLAAERISKIFTKTADMLRRADNKVLWELDFPEDTYRYIRLKTIQPESVIARLDFANTPQGYKVLEINTDTPTFIKECFHVNGLVCKEFGARDPNQGMEKELGDAVRTAIVDSFKYIGGTGIPYVVFTSHGEHIEDKYTSLYLMEQCGLVNATYCPLDGLKINEHGLYDAYDRKIDIHYRQTYPIEDLIHDRDGETNVNVGRMLLNHVIKRKVAVLNPPSAFLLQSKGVQVIIWGLHEEATFFTDEEHEWIERYMLPTYYEAEWFIEDRETFVKKPSFGREGDTVEIFNPDGSLRYADKNRSYTDCSPVYQQYAELPKATIKTLEGKKEAHLLTGCFLINGKASAIGLRAGNIITDNASYYLPVGIK
jgi:glutathionylspermidine synthase